MSDSEQFISKPRGIEFEKAEASRIAIVSADINHKYMKKLNTPDYIIETTGDFLTGIVVKGCEPTVLTIYVNNGILSQYPLQLFTVRPSVYHIKFSCPIPCFGNARLQFETGEPDTVYAVYNYPKTDLKPIPTHIPFTQYRITKLSTPNQEFIPHSFYRSKTLHILDYPEGATVESNPFISDPIPLDLTFALDSSPNPSIPILGLNNPFRFSQPVTVAEEIYNVLLIDPYCTISGFD